MVWLGLVWSCQSLSGMGELVDVGVDLSCKSSHAMETTKNHA